MLRAGLALLLSLAAGSALAQVNPGGSPLSGKKGGTNNAFMQFSGPAASMKTYTLPNVSETVAALGQIQTWTGAQSFGDGKLILLGSSSGSTTLKAPATGGGTATLFQGTDTVVGRATADVLTNKTIVCANQTSCVIRLANDVIGNLSVTNLNGGTSASSSTFWRGDGQWATPAGGGNVSGSGASTAGNLPKINNTSTTTIVDSGIPASNVWVLLNTMTASSSTSLSDTSSITASYNDYLIVFENVIPSANNASCQLQLHSGGAFQSTGYVSNLLVWGTVSSGVSSSTAQISCSGISATANTGSGISGTWNLSMPSGTSVPKNIYGQFTHNSSGTPVTGMSAGSWLSNGAVDGFIVAFNSGVIASGVIKIYGHQ